jgi:hypothetical protein
MWHYSVVLHSQQTSQQTTATTDCSCLFWFLPVSLTALDKPLRSHDLHLLISIWPLPISCWVLPLSCCDLSPVMAPTTASFLPSKRSPSLQSRQHVRRRQRRRALTPPRSLGFSRRPAQPRHGRVASRLFSGQPMIKTADKKTSTYPAARREEGSAERWSDSMAPPTASLVLPMAELYWTVSEGSSQNRREP